MVAVTWLYLLWTGANQQPLKLSATQQVKAKADRGRAEGNLI